MARCAAQHLETGRRCAAHAVAGSDCCLMHWQQAIARLNPRRRRIRRAVHLARQLAAMPPERK